MANDRSGNPSGNPKRAAKDSVERAADGWPSWMGEVDPSLAPAPPPIAKPPKLAAAPRPVVQRAAASRPPAAAAAPLPVPVPAPAPAPAAPRRWLRSLLGAFAVLLALVAGDLAGRSRPETALRFQQIVADALGHVPASFPALPVAAGLAVVLYGIAVWQAGRRRKPLFLPILFVLCAASAALGLFRGGRDIDLERSSAQFKGRVASLESELGSLRKKLNSAMAEGAKVETLKAELTAMAQALERLERKLKEQTTQALEAQAERDKLAGERQTSSLAHQAQLKEKDEVLSALRKELEDLKKKLAEKN